MAYFWIFLGGGLGSLCRYALAKWLNGISIYHWGTLLANGLSCIVLGALLAMISKDWLSGELRLVLVTGFCGGFSTFSTFSNELFRFLKAGHYFPAGVYLLMSLMTGLLAIWVGIKIIET